MSPRTLVTLTLGACFGAAAFALLVPPPPPCATCAPPGCPPPPAPPACAGVAEPRDVRALERPAVFLPPPTALPANAPVELVTAENARLRDQLAAVQGKLAMEFKATAAEHGEPVAPPRDLPPRFAPEQLRAAVTDALREAGFAGAQVTSIDCTEYPCIVYGEGMSSREEFEKLEKADALRPYADDSHNSMGWGRKGEGGKQTQQFGMAVYAKSGDGDAGAGLRKRVGYRARQMQDSNEGP